MNEERVWDKKSKRKVTFVVALTLFFVVLTMISFVTMLQNPSTACASSSGLVVLMVAAVIMAAGSITISIRTKGKGLSKKSSWWFKR